MDSNIIAAVCISRRSVAAAVFAGTHLEFTRSRQLSSSLPQAEQSVCSLLNWLAFQFEVRMFGIVDSAGEARASHLDQIAEQAGRALAIPIWRLKPAELFRAFAEPPIKSRHQLRAVIANIWPTVSSKPTGGPMQDAVAAGLYIQVERMILAAGEERAT